MNLGRGYFDFTPVQGYDYYLEAPGGIRYPLNVSAQPEIDRQELTFSVTRKVLSPGEDLEVRIFTNEIMVSTDVYIVGIFVKEQYVYLE